MVDLRFRMHPAHRSVLVDYMPVALVEASSNPSCKISCDFPRCKVCSLFRKERTVARGSFKKAKPCARKAGNTLNSKIDLRR